LESLNFDSNEEEMFFQYLQELCEAGYVNSFEYQPKAYELSDEVKYDWNKITPRKEIIQSTTLLREHIYTSDFLINWNIKAKGIFYNSLNDKVDLRKIPFVCCSEKDNEGISIVDIKPSFDNTGTGRAFVINAKWVWQKYQVYIQKIVVVASKNKSCLFKNTFTPKAALYTKKTKKLKKYSFQTRSLEEFIEMKKKGSNDI
jgi:hypothetical protein